MKEFTERHHAFIAATFYTLLEERFGSQGEAVFVLATQRYGEQRGSRMAQRAIRDNMPLDFTTYAKYGEWVNTKAVIDEGVSNQKTTISVSPDNTYHVTRCPWAAQFKDMGIVHGGTVYCTHIDKSICRGYNPALVFEVPQSLHESEYCIQVQRGANFKEGQTFERNPANMKPFDYHCGHNYKTYSELCAAVLGSAGARIASDVLEKFAETYGRDMADHLLSFKDTDFNLI